MVIFLPLASFDIGVREEEDGKCDTALKRDLRSRWQNLRLASLII